MQLKTNYKNLENYNEKKIQTTPKTPKLCFGFYNAKLRMDGKVN